jgi:anti-sigma B factor antagonist
VNEEVASDGLLDIERIDGGLAIRGEVDLSNIDRFSQEVHGAARPGIELIVDLSECRYMGSEGIGVLIQAWKVVRDGGRLVLRAPTPTLRRVLEMAGLEKFPQVDMPTEAAG